MEGRNMSIINRAIIFAAMAHKDQTRKSTAHPLHYTSICSRNAFAKSELQ